MRISNITYPDVNNGNGFRVTLWVQGCTHHCKGCHNKDTWDFKGGYEFDEETKKKLYDYLSKPYIKGLTVSGGDPIDSYYEIYNLLLEIREKFKDKDIWLYTGYTFEYLKESKYKNILDVVDVLVDGEYKEELRDVSLPYRGSSNQRILKNDFWKK